MAVSTAQVGNLSITTQVVPAGENNVPGLASLPAAPNWTQVLAQQKKPPVKSLSAVIILIGALQLCIGVSMYVAENNYLSLLSRSGASCWGGVAFIAAGIVTVVFANEESITQIKACLISHLVNVTCAAIGIILYAVQVYIDSHTCWTSLNNPSNKCVPQNATTTRAYDDYRYYNYYYWDYEDYISTLRVSLHSLLLLYVVVGLLISVSIILLRWKSLRKARYTLLGN